MRASLQTRLARMQARLEEVNASMSSEAATQDMNAYRSLTREHAELTEVLAHHGAWLAAQRDLDAARQMVADAGADEEMRAFAGDEIADAQARSDAELAEIERLLLPRDPQDAKDVILEIRAGTGGDESALFAGDLLRMYLRHCERRGWRTEVLSASESELGGYREVIVRIEGRDVYGHLKFESGVHRVQRVPQTEAQGRIHTSACTVAVMAEADELGDLRVDPEELRIDVYRASGAGGQHVNKTESAVRITHLPTGIVAECQDDRSQHRNKEKAMKVLLTRLTDVRNREAQQKEAAHRKSLVGSGDRSERIRTYNFPQGRVTDHRINLTLYKLAFVMDGDLDELIAALVAAQVAEQVKEMEAQA
ncbi:MAG: peptide chain release factor 1 [Lautropia sp.]